MTANDFPDLDDEFASKIAHDRDRATWALTVFLGCLGFWLVVCNILHWLGVV